VNFIQKYYRDIVIITNKIIANLDLNMINKYIKNINVVDSNKIMSLYLSQYKLYLKILGISYYIADIIEIVLQMTHIFNNIILASCPHVIKASSKSDIAVI